MQATLADGWLVLDGDRAFKYRGLRDAQSAAREIQRGSRVGVLAWYNDESFAWLNVPRFAEARTARTDILAWISQIELDSRSQGLCRHWAKFTSNGHEVAVILVPFE